MMFNDSKILITGGTGSWGKTLTRLLLEEYNPKEIIIFSRGELAQVMMRREFTDSRIKYVIGDVRDYDSVYRSTIGVDYVFHLAALKHVPICEDHPQEAIKTNIDGTTNIVNASIENRVKKVIDVSTDKAVEPSNLYGMTKSVGEKIIIQANELSDFTKFVCVRGGNVMGSNGSVIPLFTQQIKNGGPLTITDERMTRYFLTLEEAIRLLFKASETSIGGEMFVMHMPSCYIKDLAEVLMETYGQVEMKEIGIRPGEKFHETLISIHESILAYEYDENYYVILPSGCSEEMKKKYEHLKPFGYRDYSSKTFLMNKQEIKKMLSDGDFI